MAGKIFQAVTCLLAAKSYQFITKTEMNTNLPPASIIHLVANGMDDCISYNTHKYIERKPIEDFMGSVPGSGIFGFWRFKDRSRLIALCGDVYCITVVTDMDGKTEELMMDATTLHMPKIREQLLRIVPPDQVDYGVEFKHLDN